MVYDHRWQAFLSDSVSQRGEHRQVRENLDVPISAARQIGKSTEFFACRRSILDATYLKIKPCTAHSRGVHFAQAGTIAPGIENDNASGSGSETIQGTQ